MSAEADNTTPTDVLAIRYGRQQAEDIAECLCDYMEKNWGSPSGILFEGKRISFLMVERNEVPAR